MTAEKVIKPTRKARIDGKKKYRTGRLPKNAQ